MPTWGEILEELRRDGENPFDRVRRRYMAKLYDYTKRETILYATRWTQPERVDPELLSISEEDIQGMMEVVHGLRGPSLDLILHSPGGSAEAVEAIVSYLRTKFTDIRVIIPQSAMSAATMLACASDRIVMGKHSFISPIDPQMILSTQVGVQSVPAQAILDQFEMAKSECEDPRKLGSWLPILSQYGPALLVQCKNALDLSQKLVSEWLRSYMFKNSENAEKLANDIAGWLADHKEFKSHGRHISREKARAKGLVIEDLESDQIFQDLVLSVFHCTTHTFSGTAAVKIIENHRGKAFIKMMMPVASVVREEPKRPG